MVHHCQELGVAHRPLSAISDTWERVVLLGELIAEGDLRNIDETQMVVKFKPHLESESGHITRMIHTTLHARSVLHTAKQHSAERPIKDKLGQNMRRVRTHHRV
jgi:hypothetical protein